MIELNTCDCCGVEENTLDLIWIDSEDFEPFESDNLDWDKLRTAIENGYSALCEGCYEEECLDGR